MAVLVLSAQMIGLCILALQVGRMGRYDAAPSLPCYDQYTTASSLAALSNMAFTFGGHGVFPEQIREMTNPSEFPKAFDAMYAFAAPMYFGTAALGFWAFGNAASANPLENLQDGPLVKIYLWATLLTTYPLVVVGQVVLFLNAELSLDVLPTDVWTNSRQAAAEIRAPWRRAVVKMPPVLFRFLFRSAYVGAMFQRRVERLLSLPRRPRRTTPDAAATVERTLMAPAFATTVRGRCQTFPRRSRGRHEHADAA